MSFYILIGAAAVLWLFSLAAAIFGLRWTLIPGARRTGVALIASCLAVASAYFGLSRFHFAASKTVNNQLVWSFNSKWFFLASLILGVVPLGLALWHLKKSDHIPLPT